jgi:hypothetical protein
MEAEKGTKKRELTSSVPFLCVFMVMLFFFKYMYVCGIKQLQ